ncbi:hypothetical protein ACFXTN_018816 [Malus domestica]|uniref:uncharacterized protein n=1 Tax=Malus domestica TaxID=3750 RepID=UPI000498D92A
MKYIQVLKIWDILPLEDIPKLTNRFIQMVSSIFAMRHVLRVIWKFLKAGHPIWIFPPPRFKDPSNTDAESDLVGDTCDGRRYVENSQFCMWWKRFDREKFD